jgi:hypothetical protein
LYLPPCVRSRIADGERHLRTAPAALFAALRRAGEARHVLLTPGAVALHGIHPRAAVTKAIRAGRARATAFARGAHASLPRAAGFRSPGPASFRTTRFVCAFPARGVARLRDRLSALAADAIRAAIIACSTSRAGAFDDRVGARSATLGGASQARSATRATACPACADAARRRATQGGCRAAGNAARSRRIVRVDTAGAEGTASSHAGRRRAGGITPGAARAGGRAGAFPTAPRDPYPSHLCGQEKTRHDRSRSHRMPLPRT